MGALHDGHASLVERAVRENDLAVVSIFVNPTQFGPKEDFAAYPRDESADLARCERLGAAMVFAPSLEEMYPAGDATRVQPGPLAARLEGAARPGHFAGVATVVTKLFAIVRPDVAYFGQKDFQQLRVVQTMSRDLRLGVRVFGSPTVRDPDGLAMSSRNRYLSPDDHRAALALSRALVGAKEEWSRGERNPEKLRDRVRRDTALPGVALEYVSVADPLTLDELERPAERAVIILAARVGKARLIDNVLVGIQLEEIA
jgi:pantoate--beta-alanine ligase